MLTNIFERTNLQICTYKCIYIEFKWVCVCRDSCIWCITFVQLANECKCGKQKLLAKYSLSLQYYRSIQASFSLNMTKYMQQPLATPFLLSSSSLMSSFQKFSNVQLLQVWPHSIETVSGSINFSTCYFLYSYIYYIWLNNHTWLHYASFAFYLTFSDSCWAGSMPVLLEVFIWQTPCLYLLLMRWPELRWKSF